MKKASAIAIVVAIVVVLAIAGIYFAFLIPPPAPPPPPKIKVASLWPTPLEEPWPRVVHLALEKVTDELDLEYYFVENIGYAAYESELRKLAGAGYDLIVTDAFGSEEAARRVAKDFPNVHFFLGSELGPVDPNVAVFDNWIHEPAYICGMVAGKMTKTNIVGVVAAKDIAEVNRLVNAFKAGVKATNPDAKVIISFVGEWFNPPKTKELATAQIAAGADVIYAERYGVFEAAKEKGIPTFGNLLDQVLEAPEIVITGPVWDMYACVKEVILSIIEDRWKAMDYAEWTMMAKGGAKLAPLRDWETRLLPEIAERMKEQDIVSLITETEEKIRNGLLRVPIDEGTPVSDILI